MTVTCGHSDVLKIAHESRSQKYWACDVCGELFIPASQVKELLTKLPDFTGAHYVDIVVRRNGRDVRYEADYLRRIV